jgi:GT2 family glycosyltransferase
MNKVCISIATTGFVRAETMNWVLMTFVQMAPAVSYLPVISRQPLAHNRNLQIRLFLKCDASHLFILDNDNVPKRDTITKLLAYSKDIISAPSPAWKGNDEGILALDADGDKYKQHHPMSGLQECDAVGGSGVLVRRKVFENSDPPWFIDIYNEKGERILGNDFYFCRKMKALGYEIWTDFDLLMRHIRWLP